MENFNTERIKIGITIGLKDNTESIWTNGMKQNVLVLIKMLENSTKEYDVYLLNTCKVDWTYDASSEDARKSCLVVNNGTEDILVPKYLNGIKFHSFSEKYLEMDMLIVMGSQIHNHEIEEFRKTGAHKKVVAYKCGNNYVISMENIIFKEASATTIYQYDEDYDEIWYIPQQDEVNRGYYHTLYRKTSIIVPFIWHNKYLFEAIVDVEKSYSEGKFEKSSKYEVGKEKKRIGVMEPNINIVKFCLIPAMIAEQSYRGKTGKKHIDKLMLTNAMEVAKHKEFMGMIKTFDLFKDGKITAESRYQTAYILTQFIDVLVCHQILNPLNYLYLDAAYMGYPVLHNAPMCKDIGYYYEGSDTVAGAKKLDWILKNHDNNIEEYSKRTDKVLWRYYADNPKLVGAYDEIIHNLFNGGNKWRNYDPKTNLYK